MQRTPVIICLFAAAIVSTNVHAVQRTHVSATIGADTNTATGCTPAAPCRNFQAAMGVTDPSGEVVVLDSGGYGGANITQSVSLIAPSGVFAGISVPANSTGVLIHKAGINVVLRGLTINGQAGSERGILMTAGSKLTVENCEISNLFSGISVVGPVIVRITDTTVRGNVIFGIQLNDGTRSTITRTIVTDNGSFGIATELGSAQNAITTTDIADSTITNSGVAGVTAISRSDLATAAAVKVSVRNSRVVGNETGIFANTNTPAAVSLSASNNIVTNNTFGISAVGANANVWVSDNLITDNGTGFKTQGAIFKSAHDNVVRNNSLNIEGTLFPIAKK
jgi:hypothetical protein